MKDYIVADLPVDMAVKHLALGNAIADLIHHGMICLQDFVQRVEQLADVFLSQGHFHHRTRLALLFSSIQTPKWMGEWLRFRAVRIGQPI